MQALSARAYEALNNQGRHRSPLLNNIDRNTLLNALNKAPYLSQQWWSIVDLLEGY